MENQNATTLVAKNMAQSFRLDPQGIRNRILTIRDELGITNNKDFLGILQPIINSITTINNWTNEKDPTVPNVDALALLARLSNHSMDWIIFGNEEKQASSNMTAKEAPEGDNAIPSDENRDLLKDEIIDQLLNNFKFPVLQTSAALLNLFKYANISIIGDYDINNFDSPQSLTVKISPKCFSVYGKADDDKETFYEASFYRLFINTKETFDDFETMVYWDLRTTFVQYLLAIACKAYTLKEIGGFNPAGLLDSVLQKIKMDPDHGPFTNYYEYADFPEIMPFNPFEILSPVCINGLSRKIKLQNLSVPLNLRSISPGDLGDDDIEENISILELLWKRNVGHSDGSYFYFCPLCCSSNCEYEKIPDDLKDTVINYFRSDADSCDSL